MLEFMKSSSSPHQERFLKGQVIAVTSADKGYGRLISNALARAGAQVVLVGTQPETLAAAASSVESLGAEAIPIKSDVTVALDWLAAQDKILEIYGALHGVVHTADQRSTTPLNMLTDAEWTELFYANVKSSMNLTQAMSKHLPQSWLTIIGPHLEKASFQGSSQVGALRGLVAASDTETLRLNMILPSRPCSVNEQLDAPVCQLVLALANQSLERLRGNIIEVPLEPAPQLRFPELHHWL